MKKKIAVLLICAMTVGLTGCGSSSGTSEEETTNVQTDEESTEVVWWTYYGDSNLEYLQNIVDEYNGSQDKYHVTIEFQGTQAEMNAKIQSTALEDLPALFSGAVENVAMYAASEYCMPLQSYIDQDTEGWTELEGTWEAIRSAYCDNEGNQIGYPMGFSYPGIFYNTDMLEEAGVDPAEIKSYTDLYEACTTLVEQGYTTYGVGFHNDGYYFNAALGREGIQAYNNDNGLGSERITECLYTSNETVHSSIYNMLEVYQKLHSENLCVPFGADYQAEIIPQFASGDCAMMMGVVSMTTKVLDAVQGSFEVGIVPMISATENGKCTGEPAGGTGTFIGNNGDAEEMQGAYEFIKYASGGKQAAYFATQTGYLAPNQNAYDSEEYQKYVSETFPAVTGCYDSLSASDDSAVNPYIPISNEMKAANLLAIETIAADPNADIDDAIKTAEESIQEAIDLYNLSN